MTAVTVIDKKTGKEETAIYCLNSTGNYRYNVNGKFLTDKQFDKQYSVKSNTEKK